MTKIYYRGGSWLDTDRFVHKAFRLKNPPSFRSDNLGFRIVRSFE